MMGNEHWPAEFPSRDEAAFRSGWETRRRATIASRRECEMKSSETTY